MLSRIVAPVLAIALLAGGAFAAPRAKSALECGVAADMAVVAHSLAREEVQRPKAGAIMARIYDVAASDRGQALMKDILEAAYSHRGPSSQQFAEDLLATCLKGGGNMDPVLGQRL